MIYVVEDDNTKKIKYIDNTITSVYIEYIQYLQR